MDHERIQDTFTYNNNDTITEPLDPQQMNPNSPPPFANPYHSVLLPLLAHQLPGLGKSVQSSTPIHFLFALVPLLFFFPFSILFSFPYQCISYQARGERFHPLPRSICFFFFFSLLCPLLLSLFLGIAASRPRACGIRYISNKISKKERKKNIYIYM